MSAEHAGCNEAGERRGLLDVTTVADDLIELHAGGVSIRRDGLSPATEYTINGTSVTTLARPDGELLCRFGTVNDVHFGELECGRIEDNPQGPILRSAPGEAPYPETMNRGAVAEMRAADLEAVVVKGDLSNDGLDTEWSAFEACYRPPLGERLHVVRGNHDGYHGQHEYAGDEWIELPGIAIALLDTVIPERTTGTLSVEQLDWLDAHAAESDRPVFVMGHHQQWIEGKRSDDYFGLHPDASEALDSVCARRRGIIAYAAGHTHRHRVREMSSGVPSIEVGCVKDFPGVWAEYRVYETGVMQVVHRIGTPEALDWSERCRHLYADFGLDYQSYALGELSDRCFTIPLRPCDMTSRLLVEATRAAAVPPFHAMAMGRMAGELEASGQRVLHLEVGQPATGAPSTAVAAVTRHLEAGHALGYTNAAGLLSLRRRIARHYDEWYGVDVSPEEVLVVGGASAGFTLAFLAAFDAGDRVGVLEPGYPCYRNTLLALGIEPVAIPVGPDTRWAPTAELLDAAGPLRGLVVASPSNPTGTVLPADTISDIVAWCAANGVQLVADEIYHGITYTGPAPTVLAATRDAVVVNSFSKYFSMTGWRLGWMVVPPHLRDAAERLQQNVYICAPHIAQVAGLAAFEATQELDAHVRRYASNRDLLVDGLAAAGFDRIAAADGAFYVYADASHITAERAVGSASALCRRWLDELGVATTPGLDFDLACGERFVRFSYAGPTADIIDSCALLAGWQP